MGTRSLTILPGYDGETAVLYRQFDGYPEGHGAELAHLLKGLTEVNGLGGDAAGVFNGPSCLAATIVAHFKSEPGGFYLYPAGTRDQGEEFTYHVITQGVGNPIRLKVEGYDAEVIFDGTPAEFLRRLEFVNDITKGADA